MIAYEGEWRNILAKLRSDEEHRRMVMMHNSAVVGEKIVKVAQSYVKDKLR